MKKIILVTLVTLSLSLLVYYYFSAQKTVETMEKQQSKKNIAKKYPLKKTTPPRQIKTILKPTPQPLKPPKDTQLPMTARKIIVNEDIFSIAVFCYP